MTRIACAVFLVLVACKGSNSDPGATPTAATDPAASGSAAPAAGSAASSTASASGTGATAATATDPAHPVYTWWDIPDVEAAEDLRGGAMKLGPERMVMVTKDGKVAIRSCKVLVTGRSRIDITITGCGPETTAKLVDGQLELAQGFTMTRTNAETVAKLEELAKGGGDTCERARACYRLAWPALGRTVDEAKDVGPGLTADACASKLEEFAKELRDADKRVPAPCAP